MQLFTKPPDELTMDEILAVLDARAAVKKKENEAAEAQHLELLRSLPEPARETYELTDDDRERIRRQALRARRHKQIRESADPRTTAYNLSVADGRQYYCPFCRPLNAPTKLKMSASSTKAKPPPSDRSGHFGKYSPPLPSPSLSGFGHESIMGNALIYL